jgi:hypothetical protein
VKRLRQSTAAAFGVAIVVVAVASPRPARAAEITAATPAPARAIDVPRPTETARDRVPLEVDGVRLRGRWFETAVHRAVRGAGRRLEAPSCAAVLGDYRDSAGRALTERLRALALDAPAYARLVLIYDGSNDGPCRRPRVYAFTSPGSRVVRACPTLGALAVSRPEEAEAVVIHEVLHTLGLADDLPSSAAITAAVERRCGRADARRFD